jgi:hypothetical protein
MTRKRSRTRWENWQREDADIVLAELCSEFEKRGKSEANVDALAFNHRLRMSAAGFGKRYQKNARFMVALMSAYLAGWKEKHPDASVGNFVYRYLATKYGHARAVARLLEIAKWA